MPIGLVMNHVVFRKDRLVRARTFALNRNDEEAHDYLDKMLLYGVQDQYLLGINSMGLFQSDEVFMWKERLGLTWHDGNNCGDFYTPSIECPRATWLERANIYSVPITSDQKPKLCWEGYRLVGDSSLIVEIDDSATLKPANFPEFAKTVGPENFDIHWDEAVKISPEWIKWRPK